MTGLGMSIGIDKPKIEMRNCENAGFLSVIAR